RHSVLFNSSEGELANRQSFFPVGTAAASLGPTTAERMARFAADAPRLAVESSARALAESGRAGRDITHVVTVSCTGFMAPGLERALIDELGVPATVARTHVGF